jgi:DME family drug/metabolite transporter
MASWQRHVPSEALAIAASIFYAATQVLLKLGMKDTSVIAGLLVSLATGSLVTTVAFALWASEPIRLGAIPPFVVAGMLGAAFGRILTIVAVDRLGPSVSVPLQGSIYPLSAVIFGLVFLDENLTIAKIGGVTILLAGIWLLSRVETHRSPWASTFPKEVDRRRITRPGVIFPLLAGLCYAGADFFRKRGILVVPDPLIGTMIGVVTSFVFWSVATAVYRPLRAEIRFGNSVRYFVFGGLTSAAAVISVIHAFKMGGEVSTISPIVAAQPLPTLVLSSLFLRGIDRITRTIVLGALLVVGGVVLISG